MGGRSPNNMVTMDYLLPADILLRTGIRKQGQSGSYALYQHDIAKSLSTPFYFKLRAIEHGGMISKFTEVFER